MMTNNGHWVTRITRDMVVASTATGLLAFEVIFGGGRAAVLTALVGLLVSPVIMRVDEARKKGKTEVEVKPDE